ncbi:MULTISPECIES: peptide ABC transporter substrate-binding protein [unclassified Sedimentibacter]|uniref:peptide ABC transporter substrate-binding protein n=1 Tax=unclassified Sedimentibacter TaxID=2649220 RepID=UPI0027E1A4E2|nr:peptide ABC transporter substrate-binding protein [Sedimentibacter sp. MB35-C1]WMJ75789.1 peptide ABC transporter substrate-binding protein [Sedimentibacter sp. MB35-C1]
MLKRVLALIVVLAMVFSIVGCAKQEAPAPTDEPAEETPSEEQPAEQAAGNDDYLVWNIAVDSQTWDPTLNSSADGGHIIQNLFEGLTRETKDGIEAAAADSWEITNDGKTYTFKLKEGLKWSDGQPLTAKDFEYAWKRACDPATASEYSFLVTSYLVGGEEFFNGEGTIDEVGVKALDDTTLEVNLKFPVSYFLSLTSFYTYMPVRQDIVEANGEGWEKNPETCISNGAFKLSEYKTGDHLTMVKNDQYWDADSIKLAGIKGLMIVEGTTALNGYENGEIQVLDSITIEQIPRLQKEDPNFKITPHIGTYYVNFNVDDDVFKDVRVRKAFSLAIDRKAFVEQVTKGGQVPATGFIPSGMQYSEGTDIRPLDENGLPAVEYGIDPSKALVEEAQTLLAEAGYPNGEGLSEVTFLYNTNENNKKIAEALQGMWKQNLGVDVTLLNQDWAVFQEERRAGNYMMARGGWLGDYGDPMTMLDLFACKSGNNDPQWRYKEMSVLAPHDKMLNPEQEEFENAIDASMLASGKDRDEQLKIAEDALMNNHVIAPIYYYTFTNIVDESVVEGVELTMTNKWDFRHAEIIK